jgi:glycosyltransferase involved in cell wall biosynthesis
MKLIYIHQHFVTNEGTSGTRSYDVSRHLVEMGHGVTMICGLHEQGSLPRMPWWRLYRVHWIDGIKVVACNAYYSNKLRVPARLWSFMKFAALATWVCLRERSADLIFATSTPLTVGIPARVAAGLKRIPYVFEVRDLWPEDLLAAGRLRPGLQYTVWEWLERFSYARAARILLVSRGFHDRLLERGFAPERLETVLLGADGQLFRDALPDHQYMREHGLDGKTVAVYTGAHGDANGLDQLLDAAECLRDRPDVAIVLIGDGKMRESLKADAAKRDLSNVHLLDPVPKHRLPGILVACHIGLMILKQIPRPRWVTPNKIFDYMFAGLPSIVNFAGTTAEMVTADGTGVASEPGSAVDLAAKIAYWADHPEERLAVGRHAREVAWQKYDRRMIARRLAEVFEAVVRGADVPPASGILADHEDSSR